jgi:hypothetical protein
MEQLFQFKMGPQKLVIKKRRQKIARSWQVLHEDKVIYSGKFSDAFLLYANALHSQKHFIEKLRKESEQNA